MLEIHLIVFHMFHDLTKFQAALTLSQASNACKLAAVHMVLTFTFSQFTHPGPNTRTLTSWKPIVFHSHWKHIYKYPANNPPTPFQDHVGGSKEHQRTICYCPFDRNLGDYQSSAHCFWSSLEGGFPHPFGHDPNNIPIGDELWSDSNLVMRFSGASGINIPIGKWFISHIYIYLGKL